MDPKRTIFLLCAVLLFIEGEAARSCHCEKSFKPVCGNDGITYENICQLECKSAQGVKLAYSGTCCPRNVCPPHRNPVCDNFGRTHVNECVFSRAQCLARKTNGRILSKVHDGECTENERKAEDCDVECTYASGPVCDENDITHENECKFERLNCLLEKSGKPGILLQHYGKCRVPVPASSEDLPDIAEGSGTVSRKETAIEIDSKDSELLKPAVGQPNNIHSGDAKLRNAAHDRRAVRARAIPSLFSDDADIITQSERLEQAETASNSFERDLPVLPSADDALYPATITDELLARIRSDQPLHRLPLITEDSEEDDSKSSYSTAPPVISGSSVLQPFDLTQPCSAAECDKTRNPVCDSNNRTHKNMCLFKFFACKVHRMDGSVVELAHMGECKDGAKTPESICPPCPVTASDTLVCDNLNKTHESLCAFARFNCMQKVLAEDERVLIHVGHCHARSLGFKLENEQCPTMCSAEQHPVCDTQGNTHINLCQFQKTNCLLRKKGQPAPSLLELKPCNALNVSTLLQHSEDESQKDSPTPNSVFPITENGEEQSTVENTTQKATFDCPQPSCGVEGLPVCDSQGTLHENVCMFLHARCLAAKDGINLATQPEEYCLKAMCDKKNCSSEEKPVCGSNFLTYTNLCYFNAERCKDDKISILFYGRCEECLPTPCPPIQEDAPDEAFVCDQEGFTRTVCEYQMLSCIVERSLGVNISIQHAGRCCEPTVPCDMEPPSPLCGSDGRTYRNNCSLSVENCRNKKLQVPEVKVAFSKPCEEPPPITKEAKEALAALERLVEEETPTTTTTEPPPPTDCPVGCDNIYAPVCGSDDITYTNLCHMKAANCHLGTTVELAYNGECCSMDCPSHFSPVCDDQGITHQNLCFFGRERCIVERVTGKNITIDKFDVCEDSTCDKDCPKTYKPICASNGETVVNECYLEKLNCFLAKKITSTPITKLFDGECCANENCGYEFSPVCDSLGETHANECVFRKNACLQKKKNSIDLTIQYRGQCCNRHCEKTHAPVCDGTQTYENICEFKIAQCEAERQGQVLTLAYAGECCTLPEGKCERSGSVCDSDGQTHVDVCHFQQKRCIMNRSINKTITIVHSGECCTIEACHKGDSSPVCDTHGGTHATKCHFQNTKCIHDKMHPNNPINLAYTGACCSNSCESEPDEPVCDQHGNMYRNRCHFKYKACERRRRMDSILLETPCPTRRTARSSNTKS